MTDQSAFEQIKNYTVTAEEKKNIKKELDSLYSLIKTNKIKGIIVTSFTDQGWGTSRIGLIPAAAANAALDQARFELAVAALEESGAITINDNAITNTPLPLAKPEE
jgi:muramoyltetrapeptide carboxypeptidase LdcA involved in peptidoglycan recycling